MSIIEKEQWLLYKEVYIVIMLKLHQWKEILLVTQSLIDKYL